jgi:hypothetical protein
MKLGMLYRTSEQEILLIQNNSKERGYETVSPCFDLDIVVMPWSDRFCEVNFRRTGGQRAIRMGRLHLAQWE